MSHHDELNQLFANYIEVQSSGRHGFNGGSLADSHLNFLITGGNKGHGIQLASHVQINQIHTYLNGKSGLYIIGKQNQIGLVRANHNQESGVLLSNADNNTIDSLLAYNNGYATKEEKKSDFRIVGTPNGQNAVPEEKKSGVKITGTSRGNIIKSAEAIDDQAKEYGDEVTPDPTQCHGVYLKATGGENRVDQLVAYGNANRSVFFHSNTIGKGDVVAQPQRQTINYAAAIRPNPNLGELVIVNPLTGNIVVEAPETVDCNEGQRLTFEFTQDSVGGREMSFVENKFVTSWIPDTMANSKNYITFTYISGRWVQMGSLPGPSSAC